MPAMTGINLEHVAQAATEKRNNAVRKALKTIRAAQDEYLKHVESVNNLLDFDSDSAAPLTPEPLNLEEFADLALKANPPEPKSDLDRIRRVLPAVNVAFGLGELRQRYADAYPDRSQPSERTWPVYLSRLRKEGHIITVKKQHGSTPGVYAVAGSTLEVEAPKKSRVECAIEVLAASEKAMLMSEIVDALVASGQCDEKKRHSAVSGLTKGFNRRTDEVVQRGKKWRMVK